MIDHQIRKIEMWTSGGAKRGQIIVVALMALFDNRISQRIGLRRAHVKRNYSIKLINHELARVPGTLLLLRIACHRYCASA